MSDPFEEDRRPFCVALKPKEPTGQPLAEDLATWYLIQKIN